jgi:two-component system, NtrC family, sensor kinase
VRSLVKLRLTQEELSVRNALLQSTNAELRDTMAQLREAGSQLVQAERLAAVGELAAGVAHEVNNPVNYALNAAKTLRTYVDDVREVAHKVAEIDARSPEKLAQAVGELEALRARLHFDDSSEALAELAGIVEEGLERTSRLVGDLRDFAAPGDKRSSAIDVVRGLRSTLQLVGHALTRARVRLELDLPGGLARVQGDARALNQVFLNLIKNAAEAFEDRGGTISVRARGEGDWIVVEVHDDGPGVDPELRERLFEPFFTTKPSGHGTGLGLSISRRIVAEHGGTIDLASEPGRGTTVRVRLPAGQGGDPVASEA